MEFRAEMTVSGEGYAPQGEIRDGDTVVTVKNSNALRLLLTGAALCSNAKLIPLRKEKTGIRCWAILQKRVLALCSKGGIDMEL